MIKRDELKPGVRYRIPDGASWTDDHIQHIITNKAAEYGIAVGFRQDCLCDNTFTGLLKLLTTDCSIIYNAQSKAKRPSPDYIMITQREGTYLFITFNEYQYSLGGSNWCAIMGDVFQELFG